MFRSTAALIFDHTFDKYKNLVIIHWKNTLKIKEKKDDLNGELLKTSSDWSY